MPNDKRRQRSGPKRRAGQPRSDQPARKSRTAQSSRATKPIIETAREVRFEEAAAQTDPLLIAGVGASAGGLEAFSQLLESLPKDPGLAIVLVQHLAPQHQSALPVLLSGRTQLEVVQATEGIAVQRNRVYVIPPNVQMGIRDDVLHLLPRPRDRSQYTPIDYFLHSLAESSQDRAIAVILSGTASDGTAGVRDVKAVGGITIAQDPDTAKYDGMPRAAIASGFVDLVLKPSEIAAELVSIVRHPFKQSRTDHRPAVDESPQELHMEQIFSMLRGATGVDFRRYKRPTIDRRLQRRLVLHKLTRLDQYVRYLRENPGEVQALYSDILIHVTRFFRDRDTLHGIATHVLPRVIGRQAEEQPIRVWVPGCSTGEEAYSAAMIVLSSLADLGRSSPVQIFATDISDPAIDHARSGFYSDAIAADVTADELRRFFTKTEGGYRINKAVRDVCIFARQDLTRDPPFSKLDIVLCRNVLIYMGVDLQKRLLGMFHYALKPNGFLVLGNAESIGPNSDLFVAVDRKLHIYQKKLGVVSDVQIQLNHSHPVRATAMQRREPSTHPSTKTVEHEASRIIEDRYAPPGLIVDSAANVVQFRGQTGMFLEPAPGEPNLNVLKMAREGLLHGLREALQQARKSKRSVRKRGLRVRANGGWREVNLEVVPLLGGEPLHFLLLFDDVTKGSRHRERPQRAIDRDASTAPEPANRRVARLQQELATSREYLQSIIQDLEAANEELQSANEEVLSANEELQSTNEELDTAKEELQSTNEELNTVNEELRGRNDELSRVNSDLVNLLSSVQIAIVIVASDLRIRRFTPIAERVLNLIPGDVGRPIGHIKPNIDCPDLEGLITQVIDTVTPAEREVRDTQGNVFTLRIRPYKNLENRIDGAVLALFDSQSAQQPSDSLLCTCATMLEAINEPVALLDDTLRVRSLNRAFSEVFSVAAADAVDRPLFGLNGGQWDGRLRELLEQDGRLQVDGIEIDHEFPALGRQRVNVNVRRVGGDGVHEPFIVLSVERPRATAGRQ
jgi:two-component system CheB/CheR fusion protein